jgi:hypothetical protein
MPLEYRPPSCGTEHIADQSAYDVFHLTWFAEPVKCLTGLAAGLISTTKLYDSHWRASLGKG